MCKETNLQLRALKAEAASRFVGLSDFGQKYGIQSYNVPASNGRRAEVTLDSTNGPRMDSGPLMAACLRDDGPCLGNSHNETVCYHVLATLIYKAFKAELCIEFRATREAAIELRDQRRRECTAATYHRVVSKDGGGEVFYVVTPATKKGQERLEAFAAKFNQKKETDHEKE